MEKTRMPTVAGLLAIISGILCFPSAFVAVMGVMYPEQIWQIFFFSMFVLFHIAGVLAIVGGIYALSRKKWRLALAGSIAALFPLLLPGIAAIVLTARSKKEFQLRGHNQIKKTSTELAENVAGLLCYVLTWVSGVAFILIERENKFVRFHAMQSIIVFGTLMIVTFILRWIPFLGQFFFWIILLIGLVLWIALIVMAYQGKKYKLPWVGNLAEKWVG